MAQTNEKTAIRCGCLSWMFSCALGFKHYRLCCVQTCNICISRSVPKCYFSWGKGHVVTSVTKHQQFYQYIAKICHVTVVQRCRLITDTFELFLRSLQCLSTNWLACTATILLHVLHYFLLLNISEVVLL